MSLCSLKSSPQLWYHLSNNPFLPLILFCSVPCVWMRVFLGLQTVTAPEQDYSVLKQHTTIPLTHAHCFTSVPLHSISAWETSPKVGDRCITDRSSLGSLCGQVLGQCFFPQQGGWVVSLPSGWRAVALQLKAGWSHY